MDSKFESKTGESFKPDSFPIIFREGSIVFDFKKTTPRIDKVGKNKSQTIVTEHQAIVMTPQKAKKFKKLLDKNIERYEEKHGEIEVEEIKPETEKDQEPDTQDYIA